MDREFLARRGIAYTHAYYEGVAHTILPLAAKFTKEYCRLTESCEEIIAAVSYTHLDVYKRQVSSTVYWSYWKWSCFKTLIR